MASTSFEYERLVGPRDFRLITLCQGDWDDTIAITIEHACLEDERKPEYEALSYVWGPQYPSYNVRCNNSRFSVGVNLRDALRYIRKPDAPTSLWIDRIAINQDDSDERGQQVSLMADIFSSASMVIVWLGNSDDSSDAAFRLIDDLTSQQRKVGEVQQPKNFWEAKASDHSVQYPASNDPSWKPVVSLLQRPWFFRVCTFQEIVLARKAVLLCGHRRMTWNHLAFFLIGLETWVEGYTVQYIGLEGAGKLAFEILKCRTLYHSPTDHEERVHEVMLSLFPLLDALRQHKATDPRDKVFALLNIARDTKDSDLRADYSKSPTEIYAMTVRWLLRTQKSLAFLSMVEKKDKAHLISWVPDFRSKDLWNFLHQPRQVYRGRDSIYRASGSAEAAVNKDDANFQLTVHGVLVGTIVDRTEPPGNNLSRVSLGPSLLDGGKWPAFAESCSADGFYPPTGEAINIAYQRLRIWDCLINEGSGRRRRKAPLTELPAPRLLSYHRSQDDLIHGRKTDTVMQIISATTRKRTFKTDTGFMGLAHRSVEVGDKIYVLMGGDYPFVLRPMGGSFFGFGGESYVHGIMDGEMLAMARAKKEGKDCDWSTLDRGWTETLKGRPWPFQTEELILV